MPINYEIDERLGRVTVEFRGTITDTDLMTTFHELYGDPRHRLGMPELTDCRAAERVEISGEGLRRLAEATAALLDPSRQPWKVAILVPSDRPLLYGLSRMYELLREGSPEHVRVFSDPAEADVWLRIP